ncbi:MAG: phage portal protein [Ruminococcus sp.]|nr:phage portal protein [Ruminococcus sp.]
MNSQLIKWLNEKYGYEVSEKYYEHIDIWLNWWRGYYEPFHRIKFSNGKMVIKRDIYTLKMGKKVCEDWAAVLLNSKTHIKISDGDTNLFVQGTRETGGILGANSFWTKGNRLIEKTFATGTGAVTIHASGVKLREDGTVETSPDAEIQLNYLSAEFIIPLSVDNDRITEAAFASETFFKGKKYLLLEVHRLENGNYVIENYRFLAESDKLTEVPLPNNMIARFNTGAAVPWFAVVMPNIENNAEDANGLGLSILHGAIDALKAVDLCFNNFCSDIYLGAKKVFMEKKLIEMDEDGTPIAPDDVNQQLFTFIDFPLESADTKKFIMEFNPALRVDDNTKGVQSALDYLSFKCGLGNKHYQFNSGTVVTATQYTGDQQDLIQNADKHYAVVEQFLISLVRSIIHIGKHLMGADIAENADIEIDFDRSVIIDDTAERLQDSQDVRDGLMAKWEYRMKYYGETEEDARAVIDEISGSQDDDVLMGFGGA